MAVNKVIYNARVLLDLTADTVDAASLLAGKTAHDKSGAAITGTMPEIAAATKTLTDADASFTIPAGHHGGEGVVQIVTQTKSVTPSTSAQTVTPDAGKLLSAVTVAAAAAGKQVYSGTVTPTGSGMVDANINTGITIAEDAVCLMIAQGNGELNDAIVITAAICTGTENITSYVYNNGNFALGEYSNLISTFGNYIIAKLTGGVKYTWCLIQ